MPGREHLLGLGAGVLVDRELPDREAGGDERSRGAGADRAVPVARRDALAGGEAEADDILTGLEDQTAEETRELALGRNPVGSGEERRALFERVRHRASRCRQGLAVRLRPMPTLVGARLDAAVVTFHFLRPATALTLRRGSAGWGGATGGWRKRRR